MLFVQGELKELWAFYLAELVFSLGAMISPFVVVYFLGVGLTFFQIMFMLGASYLAGILFEVPTGAYADTKSRKQSSVLGYFLMGISFFLVPFFTSFTGLFILWFCVGISITFISGAHESWVVSNIQKLKKKKPQQKSKISKPNFAIMQQEYFIKAQSISMFGMVISPLIGGILVATTSFEIMWYVMGIGTILSALILLFFTKELNPPKQIKEGLKKALTSSIHKAKEGFVHIFKHPLLKLLVIAGTLVSLTAIVDEGWEPLLVNFGMPIAWLGYLYSALALLFMFIPFLARWLKKYPVRNVMIWTVAGATLAPFLLLFVLPGQYWLVMLLFFFNYGFMRMSGPILNNYWHDLAPEKIRATIISVKEMIRSFFTFIPMLFAGYLLDVFGPQLVIGLLSLFGVFAIAAYARLPKETIKKMKKKKSNKES